MHARRLWRAVRPLCPSDADAEDVVQDTFVKAFGALDRYEPRPGVRFISWLSTIALNTGRKRALELGGLRLVEPANSGGRPRRREGRRARTRPASRWTGRASATRCFVRSTSSPSATGASSRCATGPNLSAAEVARVVEVSEANVRKICQRQRGVLLDRMGALLEEKAS